MTMRKLLMVPATMALLGFGAAAHAQLWTWSFTDMGVNYSLSFDSLSGNTGTFTLTLDTTGYNHTTDTAFLDAVDIKAWEGTDISFSLLSAPSGSTWAATEGPTQSGPVGTAGCGGSDAGFACVEAVTKGVFNVVDGDPYTFQFQVTADSFNTTFEGSHVGAAYANRTGRGSSFGVTSIEGVPAIPEPETYAMLLAGLGLMGFVARRRQRNLAAA